MTSSRRDRSGVVLTRVGATYLAFDTGQVDAVDDWTGLDGEGTPASELIDLEELLRGRQPAQEHRQRRILKLLSAGKQLQVLVGESLSFVPMANVTLHPLPTFLEELRRVLGVEALIRSEGLTALLLDVGKLLGDGSHRKPQEVGDT